MDDTEQLKPIIAGKYVVEWEVDAGAMGRVFAATQLGLERAVALKIMSEATPEFRERFLVEAQSLARLNHRNIVTIYDFGETSDGLAFIVMEYLRGATLADAIKRERRLEPLRALWIAAQVTKGLRAAHRQRIVHRDLKPSNIFLVEDEDDGSVVKIFDFGIAKAQVHANVAQTRSGVIVGTPSYMAPEQVEGRSVDARTDLYALGVVLYQMITGRTPFIESSRRDLLLAHLLKDAPPMKTFRPDVPDDIEAFVASLLEKDPARRPPDADAVLDALNGLLVRIGGEAFRMISTDVFDVALLSRAPSSSLSAPPSSVTSLIGDSITEASGSHVGAFVPAHAGGAHTSLPRTESPSPRTPLSLPSVSQLVKLDDTTPLPRLSPRRVSGRLRVALLVAVVLLNLAALSFLAWMCVVAKLAPHHAMLPPSATSNDAVEPRST